MSAHRSGASRLQFGLFATPLEDMIAPDNPVRVVDALVDALDLEKLGFRHTRPERRGAPPFHPAVLLKLYLYGYLNRIRSSRRLALECTRNIELMWLTGCLTPNYHTIANFRSCAPHRKALKGVFRIFVQFCKQQDLLGGETVAIDGSKFRAQNSMKNNYNEAKIERQCAYIDEKFERYMLEIAAMDKEETTAETTLRREQVEKALDDLVTRKEYYETLGAALEESGDSQISVIDPDARALPLHMGIVQVAYNVQTAVDDRHNLIVACEAINEKDDKALYPMAEQAKTALGVDLITVLADKGYHTGAALQQCQNHNIITIVPQPESNYGGKETGFRKSDFTYNETEDTYTCPTGKTLTTNGQWYDKNTPKRQLSYQFKRYTLPRETCAACPHKAQCCGAYVEDRHGKHIERTTFEPVIEANRKRLEANKALYRRRQEIVEHPFGTLKRQWGFTYTLLMGLEKVNGEFGLIFTAYNLRRVMSILGPKTLIERLKGLILAFWAACKALWAIFLPGLQELRLEIGGHRGDVAAPGGVCGVRA